MNTRCKAGIIYIIAGVALVIISLIGKIEKIKELFMQFVPFFWCVGWSGIGVGVGLINTREHGDPKYKDAPDGEQGKFHLILYCGFVVLLSAITAFNVAIFNSELKIFSIDVSTLKFYALSALVGLIIGFLGHKLHDLLAKNIGNASK